MNLRGSGKISESEQEGKDGWVFLRDLRFHSQLLEKGILAVMPNDENSEETPSPSVTANSFPLKDRKFRFGADVDDPVLREEFNKYYPKQAAELFSKIPALNPYKEWDIYLAQDIKDVDPSLIPGKAIILTPSVLPPPKPKKEIDEEKRMAAIKKREAEKLLTLKNKITPAALSELKKQARKDAKTVSKESPAVPTNFKTAYFVKQNHFVEKTVGGKNTGVRLTSDIKLLELTHQERALIDIPKTQDKESFISVQPLPAGTTKKVSTENFDADAADTISQLAKKILSKENISPYDVFIHNEERRAQIFVPLDEIGLYASAWVPSATDEKNTKLAAKDDAGNIQANNFMTVVCMFGPTLRGQDTQGNEFILVKHGKVFFNAQKINKILFTPDSNNPYETMLFSELEKQIQLIKKIANPEKPINLRIHLPYIDYMLFGIELFIRGRICLPALGHFFKCILKKREEYIRKINKLCSQANIIPNYESPFENLLGTLQVADLVNKKNEDLAKIILSTLDVSPKEINPTSINEKQQKENERKLVEKILEKLKSQPKVSTDKNEMIIAKTPEERDQENIRRQVWGDFLATKSDLQIQTEKNINKTIITILQERIKSLQTLIAELASQKTSPEESAKENLDENLNKLKSFCEDQIQKLSKLQNLDSANILKKLNELRADAVNIPDNKIRDKEIEIWNNLIKLYNKNKINNLEDLFKFANAIEIAITAYGTRSNETISLLPLTENRIPIEFNTLQQHRRKMEVKSWEYLMDRCQHNGIHTLNDLFQYAAKIPADTSQLTQGVKQLLIANPPENVSLSIVEAYYDKLLSQAIEANESKTKKTTLLSDTTKLIKNKLRESQTKNTNDNKDNNNTNLDAMFSSPYNPTFNITHLDPVVAVVPTPKHHDHDDIQASPETNYEPELEDASETQASNNQGQVFYFNQCAGTLDELMNNKLKQAYENLALFHNKAKGKTQPSREIKQDYVAPPIKSFG